MVVRLLFFVSKTFVFKNNATFKILTNMFRRCIRHRQCDGYESLQGKHVSVTIYTLHCFGKQYATKILKLTELIDTRARIHRERVRLMCLTC